MCTSVNERVRRGRGPLPHRKLSRECRQSTLRPSEEKRQPQNMLERLSRLKAKPLSAPSIKKTDGRHDVESVSAEDEKGGTRARALGKRLRLWTRVKSIALTH